MGGTSSLAHLRSEHGHGHAFRKLKQTLSLAHETFDENNPMDDQYADHFYAAFHDMVQANILYGSRCCLRG